MSRTARSVQDYWRKQVDLMLRLPAALEAAEPEAVHDLRAASRRLKATLRVFRPLLRPRLSARVLVELDWFNSELGRARDAEVVHEHLTELLSGHPDARALLDDLAARRDQLRSEAIEMLGSDRAAQLIVLLERLVRRPWRSSVDRQSKGPGQNRIMKRVDWAQRRVSDAWQLSDDQLDADHAGLHLVRRRAKAARYGFESIEDACPAAEEQAEYYAELSELLGIVQDAVVVEQVVATYPGELAQIALAEQRRRSAKASEQARDFRKSAASSG